MTKPWDAEGRCYDCGRRACQCLDLSDGSDTVLLARVRLLEEAIRKHRDQRADDRCWLDDIALYETLGEPLPEDLNKVGDREAMLANCEKFVQLRCSDGGDWPTYEQVENKVRVMGEELVEWRKTVNQVLLRTEKAEELLDEAAKYVVNGPLADAIYAFLEDDNEQQA